MVIKAGWDRASPAIQGRPLETCVDMPYPPPYPPGAPCPGLFQSYMEHRVFDIVLFEICLGREIPSNPNISQLHGGARQKSAGNSTMMAKLLCFTFASSTVCKDLLFVCFFFALNPLPFNRTGPPYRAEQSSTAGAVLRCRPERP
jgi:hypothetical protein